jgi:hypothetical protein
VDPVGDTVRETDTVEDTVRESDTEGETVRETDTVKDHREGVRHSGRDREGDSVRGTCAAATLPRTAAQCSAVCCCPSRSCTPAPFCAAAARAESAQPQRAP